MCFPHASAASAQVARRHAQCSAQLERIVALARWHSSIASLEFELGGAVQSATSSSSSSSSSRSSSGGGGGGGDGGATIPASLVEAHRRLVDALAICRAAREASTFADV